MDKFRVGDIISVTDITPNGNWEYHIPFLMDDIFKVGEVYPGPEKMWQRLFIVSQMNLGETDVKDTKKLILKQ